VSVLELFEPIFKIFIYYSSRKGIVTVIEFREFTQKLASRTGFFVGAIKANTIDLLSKREFVIIALFALIGAGGVVAANSIAINSGSPVALGAGYAAATACDENVTIKALTVPDAATGQFYVATIALSDISQNATTGCGNKTMQVALKISGQMRYATWDIQEAATDSTFYLTAATSSVSDYYADTLLSPFQADALTNVAIAKIGSFTNTYTYPLSPVAINKNWQVITSSSDGIKLAAVVYGGYIYTSTDSGASWTERTAPGYRNWNSITSSSDGTKLAATPNGGYIYTSTDSGANWTERTVAGSRSWRCITSSSDGTKLAATTWGGNIYTSTDSGVSWTARTASGSRNWTSIVSSSDGTKLAAAVDNGYIYTSTDSGASWTERTASGSRGWYGMSSSSDGTKLAAAALPGYIYTSTDSGASWTERTAPGSRSWTAISSSSDGTKLAAAALPGYIYTSTDSGVNWTAQTASGSRDWNAITSSSDGTKLTAAVNPGYIYKSGRTLTRSSN
jgi:hypothetical protein